MKNATKKAAKSTTTKKTASANDAFPLGAPSVLAGAAPETPFDAPAAELFKKTRAAHRAERKAAKAKKTAEKAATKPAAKAKKAAAPAQGKGATILALVQRKGGATAAELQEATGWQAHSVRGFLSTANKKGLTTITSAKREDGQRVYSS